MKNCTRQLVPTLIQKTSQQKHSCLAWKTLRATNLACSSTLRALHARRRKGGPCRKHGGVFLQRFPRCLFQNVFVFHASSTSKVYIMHHPEKTDFLWKETYLVAVLKGGRNWADKSRGVTRGQCRKPGVRKKIRKKVTRCCFELILEVWVKLDHRPQWRKYNMFETTYYVKVMSLDDLMNFMNFTSPIDGYKCFSLLEDSQQRKSQPVRSCWKVWNPKHGCKTDGWYNAFQPEPAKRWCFPWFAKLKQQTPDIARLWSGSWLLWKKKE